jgi:nucleoside-diphosphate-sugar epimerase
MFPEVSQAVFPFRSVSVTGGTGTVGSQLIKVLLAQCPQVERISTTCRPSSATARRIPQSPRVGVLRGGLEDIAILRAMVDEGEIVYHLAAWLANTDMPEMTEVFVTNSLATGVLAKLCASAGKRMVFTSSHSVYFAGPYEGRIAEDGFPFRRDFVDWIDAVQGHYCGLMDALIAEDVDFSTAPDAIREIHRKLPPPFEPKIYDRDAYHVYCLTKLLAERFVLDQGHAVLRLSNVYGRGDESTQAVGEACQRVLAAMPEEELKIHQPFKKLVPAYLGDIIKTLICAGSLEVPDRVSPVFTMASQEHYLREDALLRAAADALNRIRGTDVAYRIEQLPPEPEEAFTYDLSKMRNYLLSGEPLTDFREGVREQLSWLIGRAEGKPAEKADTVVRFAGITPE